MKTVRYALEVSMDDDGKIFYGDEILHSAPYTEHEMMVCVAKALKERLDAIMIECKIDENLFN